MTLKINHKMLDGEGQACIQDLLQRRMRLSIKYTMIQVLEEEIKAFINADPHQQHH